MGKTIKMHMMQHPSAVYTCKVSLHFRQDKALSTAEIEIL